MAPLRKCVNCLINKPINKFKVGHYLNSPICKLCREQQRNARLKKVVYDYFNNKCECCGELNLKFLTIDHINNDGAEDRKRLCKSVTELYRIIIEQGFPENKYRILCYNCNLGRERNGGICPHKE